jgi:hypothetical protein
MGLHRHHRRVAAAASQRRRSFRLTCAVLISTAATVLLDAWLVFGSRSPGAVALDVGVILIWMLIVAAVVRNRLGRKATAHEPAPRPTRRDGGALREGFAAHSLAGARSRRVLGMRRERPESV